MAAPLEIYDKPANVFVAGFIGTPPANLIEGEVNVESGKLMFRSSKTAFALPDKWKAALEKINTGSKVVFGIRPEALGSPDAERDPGAVRIKAKVNVVEPMGRKLTSVLSRALSPVSPRIDPHRICAPGDEVELAMELSKVHLFDAASGNNIGGERF